MGPTNGDDLDLSLEKCESCCRSRSCSSSKKQFLKAISIWINKPHVVNRRLCGSKLLAHFHSNTHDQIKGTLHNLLGSLKTSSTSNVADETTALVTRYSSTCMDLDLSEELLPFTVIVRELIPKSEHFPALVEVIIYDKTACCVTFVPYGNSWREEHANKLVCKEVAYCIQLHHGDGDNAREEKSEVSIYWECDHKQKSSYRQQLTPNWLHSVLLEKLLNWSNVDDLSTSITSLKLVTVDRYKDVYVDLKNKYGKELVKNWTERTDPKKFVYEDIAIAAYLLLVWEEDRRKKDLPHKQSFVDLGCGNGLLVYILTKEGHKGLGIDLKRRKIWDTFGPEVQLKEQPITPSADHLFPEYDWLIGNHSDELTPWIPVIAARSSYQCNFLVLPCCHHDFVGKYGRAEKGKSQYSSYLDYVGEIVRNCGFEPEQDVLRIPSTKRICYIGRKRTYDVESESSADSHRQNFIDKQIAWCKRKTRSEPQQSDTNHRDSQTISQKMPNVVSVETSVKHTPQEEEASGVSCAKVFERLDSGLGSLGSDDFKLYRDGSSNDDSSSPNHQSVQGMDTTAFKRKFGDVDNEVSSNLQGSHDKKACFDEDVALFGMDSVKFTSEKQDSPSQDKEKLHDGKSSWVANFKVRPGQTIKNCQSVPEEVKLNIVKNVFKSVLDADMLPESMQKDRQWRKGGAVPICEAAQLFDKTVLHQLKSECGGLQTLLRNHSHIFQVTKGMICLRDFTKAEPWEGRNPQKIRGRKRDTLKTTLCWFHGHHPDGCPREKETCMFAHGTDDLREKNISVN